MAARTSGSQPVEPGRLCDADWTWPCYYAVLIAVGFHCLWTRVCSVGQSQALSCQPGNGRLTAGPPRVVALNLLTEEHAHQPVADNFIFLQVLKSPHVLIDPALFN